MKFNGEEILTTINHHLGMISMAIWGFWNPHRLTVVILDHLHGDFSIGHIPVEMVMLTIVYWWWISHYIYVYYMVIIDNHKPIVYTYIYICVCDNPTQGT